MQSLAIRTEKLGKRYKLGARSQSYRTLRESISGLVRSPASRRANRRQARLANQLWALRDVSFEVRQGDVLGIIGRNGAGKSTLLKVLSRITEPTEGLAEIRGRVGSLLEVGTGFHPELSGRENIFLSGAILGMRRAEIQRKFDQIVAFAEVETFIDTAIKHYSSGMYLRLAFAVAAHLEPAILMVDEVLAVGDMAFQRKCLGKMQEVGESGQTVLFVSHDLTAISRLAPRSLVLDAGRIGFDGPTSDAIQHYAQQRLETGATLATRKDRSGDGLVRLMAIECRDERGRPVETLGSGEELNILIGYHTDLPSLKYEDLAIDVRITDALGHPITTLSTRFCHLSGSPTLPPDGVLCCRVPSLALAAETYAIDLWMAYKGGLADAVVRSSEIRVLPAHYFETGDQPVKRKHGAALFQHQWIAMDPETSLAASPQATIPTIQG